MRTASSISQISAVPPYGSIGEQLPVVEYAAPDLVAWGPTPATKDQYLYSSLTSLPDDSARGLSISPNSQDVEVARSALTTATVFCGLVLIPYVEPPTKWWVAGDTFSGDWRPTLMAVALLAFYGIIVAVPPLHALDYVLIGVGVAAWVLLLRLAWRARLFERLLSHQGLSAKSDTFRGDGQLG